METNEPQGSTFGDKPFFVADGNMPDSWWDFLGTNRVVDPSRAEIVLHTDQYIGPTDHPNTIALLIESPAIHPHPYKSIKDCWKGYKAVLTFDELLLAEIPNAVPCWMGGGWIQPQDWKIYPKSKHISMTVSGKRMTEAHALRHEVWSTLKDQIEGWFGFMNPTPNNYRAMLDFRYNICIENTAQNWYFSEKIMDCFSTGTVPVYCGCKGIGRFFNIDGIIAFDTLEELKALLPQLTTEKYESMLPALQDNLERSKKLWSYERNIEEAFQYYFNGFSTPREMKTSDDTKAPEWKVE